MSCPNRLVSKRTPLSDPKNDDMAATNCVPRRRRRRGEYLHNIKCVSVNFLQIHPRPADMEYTPWTAAVNKTDDLPPPHWHPGRAFAFGMCTFRAVSLNLVPPFARPLYCMHLPPSCRFVVSGPPCDLPLQTNSEPFVPASRLKKTWPRLCATIISTIMPRRSPMPGSWMSTAPVARPRAWIIARPRWPWTS